MLNKYLILIPIIIMTLSLKKSTSLKGIELIKFLEGEKLTAYLDSAGIPTVGVGHKILTQDNIKVGQKISKEQSNKFLKNDLAKAEQIVRGNVTKPLNKYQFNALVSFVFNVGGNAFINSTLLKKINELDYTGAMGEFARWKFITVNGDKIVSQGLVKRRLFEQDMFNT